MLSALYASVRPSVSLSVTRVDQSKKTVEVRIMKISKHHGSPRKVGNGLLGFEWSRDW